MLRCAEDVLPYPFYVERSRVDGSTCKALSCQKDEMLMSMNQCVKTRT